MCLCAMRCQIRYRPVTMITCIMNAPCMQLRTRDVAIGLVQLQLNGLEARL